jgi:exodeoxyribonuclease III
MKIATFNVNGVNGRLPRLLEWLEEAQPDVACLQELKAPQDKFPEQAIRDAGYGAIWQGQSRWNGVAILARGCDPVETKRCLPGDRSGRAGALYRSGGERRPDRLPLPSQRQSAAGAEIRLQARLVRAPDRYAGELIESGLPVVLAGDYNVVPTDFDIYNPRSWLEMRCSSRKAGKPIRACLRRAGPTRSANSIPMSGSTLSGIISGTPGAGTRASGSTIFFSARPPRPASSTAASIAKFEAAKVPATMHPPGSRSPSRSEARS